MHFFLYEELVPMSDVDKNYELMCVKRKQPGTMKVWDSVKTKLFGLSGMLSLLTSQQSPIVHSCSEDSHMGHAEIARIVTKA